MKTRRYKRRLRRFCRRLLGETVGAVFAEAVIMLPFFILVWGCIAYVHNYYSSRIALGVQTKACAWQYANEGCQRLPAICTGVSPQRGSDFSNSDLPDGGGNVLGDFLRLPIVRAVGAIVLGYNAQVTGGRDVNRPVVLGSGRTPIRSQHAVMCNELPRTPGEVAYAAFCGMTNLCSRGP